MNKLQKYLKQVLQKLGTLRFSNPHWVGFSSKKTGCNKFEIWKKNVPYPCLGFFHQNHPYRDIIVSIFIPPKIDLIQPPQTQLIIFYARLMTFTSSKGFTCVSVMKHESPLVSNVILLVRVPSTCASYNT